MGFIEILYAIVNLNVGFLVDLVRDNLLWVAIFYAAGWYYSEGKAPLIRGIVFFALVATTLDIFKLTHFSIYTAIGLATLYFLRMPVFIYFEKTKGLSQYFTLAWILTWFVAVTVVAFGM